MIILSIETSCDETAVSLIKVEGDFPHATYEILGTGLLSQTETHAPYGGVFPSLAKRDHIQNLVPMFKVALCEADLYEEGAQEITHDDEQRIREILERETDLADALLDFIKQTKLPEFDLITVTNGPGLAPALWVGVNFAKAMSHLTKTPVVPVDHMEGHILASIYDIEEDDALTQIEFPAVALLISGGHTELVLMKQWSQYEKIGQTKDDAVGEAFDKVARLLGLPYPGGPEIERLASEARKENIPSFIDSLPRPMLHSGDLNFSFSGLKTAVRYGVADRDLNSDEIKSIARDFSDAVKDVLITKTEHAVSDFGARTLIVGGGVSASQFLRDEFNEHFLHTSSDVTVYFPHRSFSTDNAVMIALAGHAKAMTARSGSSVDLIRADSNRTLS